MQPKTSPRPTYHACYDSPWLTGLFRPLLIAIFAASALVGPLAIVRALTSWRLTYLLPLAALIALEGVYTTERLGRPQWRDRRNLVFRLGELSTLGIMTRLIVWIFGPGLPPISAALEWLRHPATFFDGQFVISSVLCLAAWGLGVAVAGDFRDLAIQPDEIAAREQQRWGDSGSEWRAFRPMSRAEIVRRFATRWTWGGVLLAFCAAISRTELRADDATLIRFGWIEPGLPVELSIALVCFFLSGLLLLSQARLALLRGHWYNAGMQIAPNILRRWLFNAAISLLLIAGIAALLPTGSTGWLASLIETIIIWIMQIIYVLLLALTLLFSILLAPLRLLRGSPDAESAAPAPTPLTLPTRAQIADRLPDWLGGAILWTVLGLLLGYFLLNYWHSQGPWRLWRPTWWQHVLLRWRARQARLVVAIQSLSAALRRRRAPLPITSRDASTPLNTLNARQKIRFFYLRVIRRAAERGLVRPAHLTPIEFSRVLRTQWPDAGDDVLALTDAFVAARYDTRPISPPEAEAAHQIWRRLMRTLHRKPSPIADGRSSSDETAGVTSG